MKVIFCFSKKTHLRREREKVRYQETIIGFVPGGQIKKRSPIMCREKIYHPLTAGQLHELWEI
jgi:hypothetical protein